MNNDLGVSYFIVHAHLIAQSSKATARLLCVAKSAENRNETIIVKFEWKQLWRFFWKPIEIEAGSPIFVGNLNAAEAEPPRSGTTV